MTAHVPNPASCLSLSVKVYRNADVPRCVLLGLFLATAADLDSCPRRCLALEKKRAAACSRKVFWWLTVHGAPPFCQYKNYRIHGITGS